jgi:hypothetical protein
VTRPWRPLSSHARGPIPICSVDRKRLDGEEFHRRCLRIPQRLWSTDPGVSQQPPSLLRSPRHLAEVAGGRECGLLVQKTVSAGLCPVIFIDRRHNCCAKHSAAQVKSTNSLNNAFSFVSNLPHEAPAPKRCIRWYTCLTQYWLNHVASNRWFCQNAPQDKYRSLGTRHMFVVKC